LPPAAPGLASEADVFVIAMPGENFEDMFARFRRGVQKAGITSEVRRRQRFVPAHERRREALRRARRRQARRAV